MAEAVFRQKVESAGLRSRISVDSAGTGNWHVGDPPHHGTQSILREHGITADGLFARQIEQSDLRGFDYLVVMDESNLNDVEALAQGCGSHGQIVRLLDFADADLTDGVSDVPDPYFTGGFDVVYRMVDSGCQGLLDHLSSRYGFVD
jgi:protein-tyrosine phosphatase